MALNHKILALICIASASALLAGAAAAAPNTEEIKAIPQKAIEGRLQAIETPLSGDQTLKSLLAAGFDIIHIDAPVGTLSARFILRKAATIYSCEPLLYREGGAPNMTHVVSSPCLNLTPDK